MYSFLDDQELYGSSLAGGGDGGPGRQGGAGSSSAAAAPVSRRGGAFAAPLQAAARAAAPQAVAPPAPAPSPQQELLLRSFGLLDQRLLSLEERLVAALERLASDGRLGACPPPASPSWWGCCLALALSTALALLLCRFLFRGPAPGAALPPAVPIVLQGLPPTGGVGGAAAGPPTPLFFAAPNSFLQRP